VRKAEKLILQDDVKLLIRGRVQAGAHHGRDGLTKKAQGRPLELLLPAPSFKCGPPSSTSTTSRTSPIRGMQANGLAKYIVDKMGKRVYISYTDYAMGQSDGRQFQTALEKLGGGGVGRGGSARWTPRTSAVVRPRSTDQTRNVLFVGLRGHGLAPSQ